MKDVKMVTLTDYQKVSLEMVRLKIAAYLVVTAIGIAGLKKSSERLGLIKTGIAMWKAAEIEGISDSLTEGLLKFTNAHHQ